MNERRTVSIGWPSEKIEVSNDDGILKITFPERRDQVALLGKHMTIITHALMYCAEGLRDD